MPTSGSRVCSAREGLSTHAHLHLTTILSILYSSPPTPSAVYFSSLILTTPTSILPPSFILTATTSVQWDPEPTSISGYNSKPVYGNPNCWNNDLLDCYVITYSWSTGTIISHVFGMFIIQFCYNKNASHSWPLNHFVCWCNNYSHPLRYKKLSLP